MFITNDRENSSPSEQGYPQNSNKYLPQRAPHRISPRNRQNLSAFDFQIEYLKSKPTVVLYSTD